MKTIEACSVAGLLALLHETAEGRGTAAERTASTQASAPSPREVPSTLRRRMSASIR